MIFIIMGVSGSGKSTIGEAVSSKLGWKYYEGDNFHPAANIEKMKNGIPLNDDDRMPWLNSIRKVIEEAISRHESIIISCSALKEKYRAILKVDDGVGLIYLKGSYDLIKKRMEERTDHFFKPEMLKSQFDALEEPADAVQIDISNSPGMIIKEVLKKITDAG
jgi:gluconokinase